MVAAATIGEQVLSQEQKSINEAGRRQKQNPPRWSFPRRNRLTGTRRGSRAPRGNRWPSEGMRSWRPNVSLSTEKDIKNVFPASRPIARFRARKRSEPAKRASLSWPCFIPLLTSPSMRRAESVKHWKCSKRGTGRQYRSSQRRGCFLRGDDLNSLSELKR